MNAILQLLIYETIILTRFFVNSFAIPIIASVFSYQRNLQHEAP